MKEFFNDFKKFASRGNAFDLAVGVIIGGAFGKIITSIVNDLIMPLVGIVLGDIDFTKLTYTIGNATITYGNLIQNTVNFFIIVFCVFLMVRAMMKFKKKEEAKAPAAPAADIQLLTEIRNLLKEQKTKA